MAKKLPEFTTAFGTYRAMTILGEGGSGKVFSTRSDDGNEYAVKLLDAAHASTEKARRFKNEILFGSQTRHKNLVSIVDYGVWDGEDNSQPFYVMPRYAGTLRHWLNAKPNIGQGLPMFSQILDGLEAAHQLGVVHRDIKPENILLASTGTPLIADFGIAHFTAEELATNIKTKLGSRLANFVYAAPEQRQQGRTVDNRADIFALGLILNEMFTGEVPQGTGYATISSRYPDFAFLDKLVTSMIAQRPEDRPPTIDEIKKNLIARRQEFVAQQKLDRLKQNVVPKIEIDDPIAQCPIDVIGGDWDGRNLIFKLSQEPPQLWVGLVANRGNGMSYFMSYPPESIRFDRNKAYWPSSQGTAQQQIEQFKQRVAYANTAYVHQLEENARRREEEARQKLQLEIDAEEQRTRFASGLNF